jgi:hypothetical protein
LSEPWRGIGTACAIRLSIGNYDFKRFGATTLPLTDISFTLGWSVVPLMLRVGSHENCDVIRLATQVAQGRGQV